MIEWLSKLLAFPVMWEMWEGRVNVARSAWITDANLGVRRRSVLMSQHVEKLEAHRRESRPLVDGAKVTERIAGPFEGYGEGIEAKWITTHENEGSTYVVLGDPRFATYHVPRLRLLYALTEFDRATWLPQRYTLGEGHPMALRVWKKGALVGVLMPVRDQAIKLPQEIYDEATRRLTE